MWTVADPRALGNIVRLLSLPFLGVVYLAVHVSRRIRRWRLYSRAESWPSADATVNSSYELDENETAFSVNGWEEDLEPRDYKARWSVALDYTYRVESELFSGTYFLPGTYEEGDVASAAGKAWVGRKIVVRFNPDQPAESCFLLQDGAPGKPHIPFLLSKRPYITNLSLR